MHLVIKSVKLDFVKGKKIIKKRKPLNKKNK